MQGGGRENVFLQKIDAVCPYERIWHRLDGMSRDPHQHVGFDEG